MSQIGSNLHIKSLISDKKYKVEIFGNHTFYFNPNIEYFKNAIYCCGGTVNYFECRRSYQIGIDLCFIFDLNYEKMYRNLKLITSDFLFLWFQLLWASFLLEVKI